MSFKVKVVNLSRQENLLDQLTPLQIASPNSSSLTGELSHSRHPAESRAQTFTAVSDAAPVAFERRQPAPVSAECFDGAWRIRPFSPSSQDHPPEPGLRRLIAPGRAPARRRPAFFPPRAPRTCFKSRHCLVSIRAGLLAASLQKSFNARTPRQVGEIGRAHV